MAQRNEYYIEMTKSLQNLLYIGILAVVIAFFWMLSPKHTMVAKGIFLPQTNQTYPSIPVNEVTAVPNKSPYLVIGSINTITHYDSNQAKDKACQLSMEKAREIAAKNGAHFLSGDCYTSGNAGPLDGAEFRGTAYLK